MECFFWFQFFQNVTSEKFFLEIFLGGKIDIGCLKTSWIFIIWVQNFSRNFFKKIRCPILVTSEAEVNILDKVGYSCNEWYIFRKFRRRGVNRCIIHIYILRDGELLWDDHFRVKRISLIFQNLLIFHRENQEGKNKFFDFSAGGRHDN